ncbi:MAG: hypothetical protein IH857_00660 [Deltaproteobacteria bacterium]|nr:hypothetical protein [Deltaproteobacteria bacterium]
MEKEPRQQVNPVTVRDSCIALFKSLVENPALRSDPSLNQLDDGTILTMFCVIRFWGMDSLARLSGIGAVSDWEEKFEELRVQLGRMTKDTLLDLASRTGDGTSLLLLSTARDALRMMTIVIEERLRRWKIGPEYVAYRDIKSKERLDKILQEISPKSSYYYIPGDEPEDRMHYIHVGFLEFIEKLKETPLADWDHFPHTVLGDHRPAPHPEWDEKAAEYLKRDIESTLKEDLPILSGELDNAPLQMRTVIRDIYSGRYYGIDPRTTPTPKEIETDKISPSEMKELGTELDPEILLTLKQSRDRQGRMLHLMATKDPILFWASMKHQTEHHINKTKVAEELDVSRPTLNERYEKITSEIKKLVK